MTRANAMTYAFSHAINIGNGGSSDGLSLLIDEIYNDLENQTCINCNWYSYTAGKQPESILPSQCIETCGVYSDVVPELIDREGCNRWSKK